MFRLRLAAPVGVPPVSYMLTQRRTAYASSSWSVCASGSINRYFHCTLRETRRRQKLKEEEEKQQQQQCELSSVAIASSAVASTSESSSASTCVLRNGCRTSSGAPSSSSPSPSLLSDRANFRPSTRPQQPAPLHFSLELSLPHLPNRTPFAINSSSSSSDNSHNNNSTSLTGNFPGFHACRDAASSAAWCAALFPSANSTNQHSRTPPALPLPLHQRWTRFAQLCESIHSSAAHKAATARLTGIVMPCKEPYFCPVPTEGSVVAAGALPSTTQAAVLLWQQRWRVPVTLALNTTAANRSNSGKMCAEGPISAPTPTHEHSSGGATPAGIQAVMQDFVCRRGGRRVLLVRGDTPSTQYGVQKTGKSGDGADKWDELRTGGDLVRCVDAVVSSYGLTEGGTQDGAPLQLMVAGYPQGHPMDRLWETAPTAAREHVTAISHKGCFSDSFERCFNEAEYFFDRVVALNDGALTMQKARQLISHHPGNEQLPALRQLFRTVGRLHAARQLWQTPSRYDGEVRAACLRRLIEEKVLLRGPSTTSSSSSSGGGARVIVTQMLASAAEFREFEADVQDALRELTAASSSPAAVTVVPGVLLPHNSDPHVLLRSLYYAKVVPSPRLQRALEAYRTDLKGVWRSIVTAPPPLFHSHHNSSSSSSISETNAGDEEALAGCRISSWPGRVVLSSPQDAAAVEEVVAGAYRRATARFTAAWMAETVDLLCELQKRRSRSGGARDAESGLSVHFFTMFNDQMDVRLEQLLDAYALKRQQQMAHM